MTTIDWTALYKTYRGEWVALKDDERTVVAHGTDAVDVWTRATAIIKKPKKPTLLQVPAELTTFVG